MDPSSRNSHGFVNLLASQSSPPIDIDSAEAHVTSPGLVKPAERKRWSTKEDIVLISAWLNTSKDPIVSNEQKLGSFWKRIEEYFNSSPHLVGSLPREWSQCKQRWGRVNVSSLLLSLYSLLIATNCEVKGSERGDRGAQPLLE
ncbi:hypothetical protein YC2023_032998 [Brassica napus]